ncbi:Pheromone-processing carboxypeptidase KEX1 [Seminavis robusta]|uniref:Carboxypeptidase n=1 Tax=Seminavis robusta TaxID=568900 RepID=A0A9N8HAZ0_9STRA|nr:Pheromone-processing carboxypeptidase KEX1 [Seminavis robusta]|eukprot:Sro164_g073620.1 Pheromone-processing carboxypeptidase KEX1 (623) ;mRNA; f:51462-53985
MSSQTKTPDDFRVVGLESVQPAYAQFDGEMYAGMLPVLEPEKSGDDTAADKKTVGQMMFWMFEPPTQSVENTIVVWLNGGPGCSSFNCGVMMENSPVTQPLRPAGFCCLEPTPELHYNEKYSWTQATTMLYVEQPLGTGFSYGLDGYEPETEVDVARDLYNWFQYSFYQLFPKFRNYKLFVMGESYAGMFIPAVAQHFMKENERRVAKGANEWIIPLGGAALGNGWIDATIQGPATIDYSWWHGLIDAPTRHSLHLTWQDCLVNYYDEFIDDKKKKDGDAVSFKPPFHPFNVQDDCGMMWGILQAAGGVNAYDVTTWDPNVDQVTFTSEAFYNRPDVKSMLHAPTNVTWHGCRPGGGRRQLSANTNEEPSSVRSAEERRRKLLYMMNDKPISVAPYIADLLNGGIPVLVYNGDRDMTTNMVGSELVLNQMTEWNNITEWLDAPRGLWMDSGSTSKHPNAGWAKELGGLSFVVVYNSGHMVPYNVPSPSLDLLKRFLTGAPFIDVETPQIRYSSDPSKSKKYKGAEKWMNTPEYPELPQEHSHHAAVSASSYYYRAVNFPAMTAMMGTNSGAKNEETSFAWGSAGVSFFVGMLVSVMIMQLVNGRPRKGGYQQVPEASLSDDE